MYRVSHASILIAFLVILGSVSCSGQKASKLPAAAKSILEKADQIELLSIDPGHSERDEPPPKGDYHGWKVLGKTTIQDPDIRKSVISAVERGLAEEGDPKKCFDPRHAIHASHKEKTVDILICFHCSQVQVYLDGNSEGPFLGTSSSPEAVLDKVLTQANVPLAPKPPKR
jgi:hypothetical protein